MAKLHINIPKGISYKKTHVPTYTKVRHKYLILLSVSIIVNVILTTLLWRIGYFK